jgi:hypothetical protein
MVGGSLAGLLPSNATTPTFEESGGKVVASGDLEGNRHEFCPSASRLADCWRSSGR